jgi:hypothetical protein
VGESGRWQTDELLRTETAAVAIVARHPALMQLAAALIGPAARFAGVGAMWREPVPGPPPPGVPPEYSAAGIHWQLWHRQPWAVELSRRRLAYFIRDHPCKIG